MFWLRKWLQLWVISCCTVIRVSNWTGLVKVVWLRGHAFTFLMCSLLQKVHSSFWKWALPDTQWRSGSASALTLVGCGFNTEPSHNMYFPPCLALSVSGWNHLEITEWFLGAALLVPAAPSGHDWSNVENKFWDVIVTGLIFFSFFLSKVVDAIKHCTHLHFHKIKQTIIFLFSFLATSKCKK